MNTTKLSNETQTIRLTVQSASGAMAPAVPKPIAPRRPSNVGPLGFSMRDTPLARLAQELAYANIDTLATKYGWSAERVNEAKCHYNAMSQEVIR